MHNLYLGLDSAIPLENASITDTTASAAECDIGKLLESGKLHSISRTEKYNILTREANPDPSSYLRTRPYGSGSFRQFQPGWLKQYPWLHYSRHVDGAFCRACALFAPEKAGGQTLGQFVTTPFKTWVNKSQKMNAHAMLDYHMIAMARMNEFVARFQRPSEAINVKFDKEAQKRMDENQGVIQSLLKVVMLCGKQGLALRGHRDDHVAWTEQEEHEAENHGNFIELVRFRAETDDLLQSHLKNAPKNAMYTSKTIQNELIDIVGKSIRSDILSEVMEAKYYSVIADEVTDVANKEQLSISLRYVINSGVKEVFVDFMEVERITGEVLAGAIVQSLTTWGLSLSDMWGQCYDGSANMAGARSGCRSIVQQQAPMAVYTHCAAHKLNLAVVSACKILAFKNAESYIGEIARFFRFSAKRQRFLDRAMHLVNPEPKAKKLKDACRTRWIQRIDSYAVFLELLPAVHMVLQAITCPTQFEELGTDWNWDGETATKANGFLYQLQSASFLVCFKILLEVLSCLRSLTMKLQMQAIDVMYAHKQVHAVVSTLEQMRAGSNHDFSKIFADTAKLGKDLHGEDFKLCQPRINRRQMHRSSIQTTSAEEYYRITLYNEFLSHVVTELKDRFIDKPADGYGLLHLLPSQCCSDGESDEIPQELIQAVDFYQHDLPHAIMFPTEYRMWMRKWKQHGCEVPTKLVDALQACDLTFPNIQVLLHLALTLPITSCEGERSFSQLKLIKSSHRSTMSANRLSGLALMKINRTRCEKFYQNPSKMKELVQSFQQLHPRRMMLPFVLADS